MEIAVNIGKYSSQVTVQGVNNLMPSSNPDRHQTVLVVAVAKAFESNKCTRRMLLPVAPL